VNALKLTVYFGERDRAGGRFLADALIEVFARHALRVSLVMRGAEGFGAGSVLRSDRLLSLSEDLPLVAVAVDAPERIEAALADVRALRFGGLVTLERAREAAAGAAGDETVKLTLYVGRRERVRGRLAYLEVVDVLRRHGLEGATVLLGVDGTVRGARERARFVGANRHVPLMVVSVGASEAAAAALEELGDPLATLERVQVLKRDGRRLAGPRVADGRDPSGLAVWQKLMIHAPGPVASGLLRDLRREGAAGATVLRGVWGFHGDHAPHGDALLQLRRRVPTLTVLVDTPERVRVLLEVVHAHTDAAGLVTSELVPAYLATAPGHRHGGLRLADPR
jgi:PII-like signaling protein